MAYDSKIRLSDLKNRMKFYAMRWLKKQRQQLGSLVSSLKVKYKSLFKVLLTLNLDDLLNIFEFFSRS